MRRIGIGGGLIGGLLAVAAGGLTLDLYEHRPTFVIEHQLAVFDGLVKGTTYEFSYRIVNRLNRPMRIVGAEYT